MEKDKVLSDCKANMEKRIQGLEKDLGKVRTGRASISMLDGVKVLYYGTPSPLNQIATLTTPDARTIVVSPFEKNLIGEIEKSILKADLGVTPTNDGNIVRIPIPALTEERRKDIVKNMKKVGEEVKVALRGVRRDANEEVKKLEKEKKITEDESKRIQEQIQKQTDQYVKVVDDKLAAKEKEVMTI